MSSFRPDQHVRKDRSSPVCTFPLVSAACVCRLCLPLDVSALRCCFSASAPDSLRWRRSGSPDYSGGSGIATLTDESESGTEAKKIGCSHNGVRFPNGIVLPSLGGV